MTIGAVATRIFTAWGDEDTISYHDANFAKGQVILYGGVENSNSDPIIEVASDPGVSSFEVRAVRAIRRAVRGVAARSLTLLLPAVVSIEISFG